MSAPAKTDSSPTSGPAPGPSAGRSGALMWVAIMLIVAGLVAVWTGFRYLNASRGGVTVVDTSYRRPAENSSDPWLKEYILTERSGKKVGTADLKGQPTVTSFFFASCPGYCMKQNEKMAAAAHEYGPKGVKFVSISVDSENDTPAVLREYAHKFKADDEDWLFLTGDPDYIARIGAEMFLVSAGKQTHSEKLIVSDKWGNVRGYFHWNDPAEMTAMRRLLDKLLVETEAPADLPSVQELVSPPKATSKSENGSDSGAASEANEANGEATEGEAK
jgi:protein SCO1